MGGPFDSLARCYTSDPVHFAEERGRDDAETHRGDVAFLLHRTGDGGWPGLAGNPLFGASELLMQARFAVILRGLHIFPSRSLRAACANSRAAGSAQPMNLGHAVSAIGSKNEAHYGRHDRTPLFDQRLKSALKSVSAVCRRLADLASWWARFVSSWPAQPISLRRLRSGHGLHRVTRPLKAAVINCRN